MPWARSAYMAKPASLIPFQRLPQTLTHHTRHTRTLLEPPRSPRPHAAAALPPAAAACQHACPPPLARTLAAARPSAVRAAPLPRGPPPHARMLARTPPPPPSPARRPRHARACRSPKQAAEPRRPRGRHPGAGTRPANGLDGAREPDVDALGLSPKGGRLAGLLRHLPHRCSSWARHARVRARPRRRSPPGLQRPRRRLLAAAPRLAAPRLGARRCHASRGHARRAPGGRSPRPQSLLAAATLAAAMVAAPALPAPRAHA